MGVAAQAGNKQKEEKEAMNQKEFNELVHEYRKRRHVERGGALSLTIDISSLIEEVKKTGTISFVPEVTFPSWDKIEIVGEPDDEES